MCLFATWRRAACQEQRKLSCNLSYLVFQFINSGSSLFLVFFLIPMLISSVQILSLLFPKPNNTYMNKHHVLFYFIEINHYSYEYRVLSWKWSHSDATESKTSVVYIIERKFLLTNCSYFMTLLVVNAISFLLWHRTADLLVGIGVKPVKGKFFIQ